MSDKKTERKKQRRPSSPKRDPFLSAKEKEEIQKKLTDVNDKLLTRKKSPISEPKPDVKQHHGDISTLDEGERTGTFPIKKKKSPLKDMLKDDKALKNISDLEHELAERIDKSRFDSFGSNSFGSSAEGEPRTPLFSSEKFKIYSLALDREKLKHSDIWPFDSSMDEGKYKNVGLSTEPRNPILDSFVTPQNVKNDEEGKKGSPRHSLGGDGKFKKVAPNSSFLSPIAEADNDLSEKKIDIKSVFEKCRLEGRRPRDHDSVMIADEKKIRKEISPKASVESYKKSKHSSTSEREPREHRKHREPREPRERREPYEPRENLELRDPRDRDKIRHLFSVLNIPHQQETEINVIDMAAVNENNDGGNEKNNGGNEQNHGNEKNDGGNEKNDGGNEKNADSNEKNIDAIEKNKNPSLKNISPFASFFNKLNNPQTSKNPDEDLENFTFPEPQKKDKNSKNAIKTSKTFIAGKKSSKKLLKASQGKNISTKHSSHGKKSSKESIARKPVIKVEIQPRGFDIPSKISETINTIAHSLKTMESTSFEYIPKSDLMDISAQRPSSANAYKESPTRQLKKSKKVYESPCSSKMGSERVSMGEPSQFKVLVNEGKILNKQEVNESIDFPSKESKENRFKTIINLEKDAEKPPDGIRPDDIPNFKNDNYVGVHLVRQNFTGPTENVVRFEESPSQHQTDKREDRAIKKHLRDLIFYLVFLTLVTLVALGMVSSSQFYFTDITAKLFMETPSYVTPPNSSEDKSNLILGKPLKESVTIADFWMFAESTMIDLLYWKIWFAFDDPDTHTEKDDKKFVYENFLLGVPRIRQVRVRDDSCFIHPDVSRFFDKCYDYYTIFSESTKPIKYDMEKSITKTAWEYSSAEELGNSYYWGKISTYGGGGYYLDLSREQLETVKLIQELKNNQWISRGTRAVFVDFTIYNANANLFCICKLVLEFPPMGGMIPQTDFRAVKLIRYLNKWDYFILGCEFVLVLFVVYYTYEEVIELKKKKIDYFTQWWNYIDLVILGLCYTYLTLNIFLFVQAKFMLSEIPNQIYEHISFGSIGYTQTQFNNVTAVLVFFAWVKLFKYLNFNKAMIELSGTLSRSMKDVFGFALMFFTVFIAFAQLAYLLFGSQVKDYSNVWSSSMALLQTVLGEFEYKQIEEANRVLGPIFYIVFIFFIFFVLLNMFLAIINDAYTAVKSEVNVRTDQLHVLDYTKRAFLNLLGISCCGLDKKLESKRSREKRRTYAEVKEALKRAGYSDLEVEMFLTKYEIDINQLIDKGENERIIEDLELRRLDLTDDKQRSEMEALKKEIERLNDKFAEMQRNLIPVIEKVDILLRR